MFLLNNQKASMRPKTVSYTLDTLPSITEAQEANLEALAIRPESEIDYSDIPQLTEKQGRRAQLGVFYRTVKR